MIAFVRNRRVRSSLVAVSLVVCFGGLDLFGKQRPDTLTTTGRITIDHIRVITDKKFADVTRAIESKLGRFDPEVYKTLAAGGRIEESRARLEAMAGPNGLMLFGTNDHGALLNLAGQKRKAIQYVVGNPLFALKMTQYDVRAGLYAPLRLFVYETRDWKTCIEYDRPSSLFGQFGNSDITPTAIMIDQKLEALVAGSI